MAHVVFMGTPEFGLPSLEALHAHHEVVLVITQPDRRRGRGRHVSFAPVKKAAMALGLPVWQPPTLKAPEALDRLREIAADVYVTAAIGLLVPPEVLALPPHGCLNVHASLLPRWRGAAPVNAAILHGDTESGVTLMQTEEGLDTGPILAQVRCAVGADDTAASLSERLSHLGAELLIEVLPHWLSGLISPRLQPTEGITLAPRLRKEDGLIDWQQPAAHIERMVRAYTPWPGAYTHYQGQLLKISRAGLYPEWKGTKLPGQVIDLPDGRTAVVAGQGILVLHEIQLAGKRALPTEAFCCGHRDFVGSQLGEAECALPDLSG